MELRRVTTLLLLTGLAATTVAPVAAASCADGCEPLAHGAPVPWWAVRCRDLDGNGEGDLLTRPNEDDQDTSEQTLHALGSFWHGSDTGQMLDEELQTPGIRALVVDVPETSAGVGWLGPEDAVPVVIPVVEDTREHRDELERQVCSALSWIVEYVVAEVDEEAENAETV